MKLTFDIDIEPNDLTHTVANSKTRLKVTGYLIVENEKQLSEVVAAAEEVGAESFEAVHKEEASTEKKTQLVSNSELIELGLSKVEALLYKTIQANLKHRGLSAGGKHGVLASRFFEAAHEEDKVTAKDAPIMKSPEVAEMAQSKLAMIVDGKALATMEALHPMDQPTMDFDESDAESYDKDYALSQDVAMMMKLRDSIG
jgi:hypothetical protein